MKNLKIHLESRTADVETANKALRDMKRLMIRKITLGSMGALGNLAFGVTLAVSLFFPISAVVFPIVALAKTLVFLAIHHVQHVWMDKGLKHREFLAV